MKQLNPIASELEIVGQFPNHILGRVRIATPYLDDCGCTINPVKVVSTCILCNENTMSESVATFCPAWNNFKVQQTK